MLSGRPRQKNATDIRCVATIKLVAIHWPRQMDCQKQSIGHEGTFRSAIARSGNRATIHTEVRRDRGGLRVAVEKTRSVNTGAVSAGNRAEQHADESEDETWGAGA